MLKTRSSIQALAAICGLSALAAFAWLVAESGRKPGTLGDRAADERASVLVVEMDNPDGVHFKVPPVLVERAQLAAPDNRIRWDFARVDPSSPAAMHAAIQRFHPRLVILFTEDLLGAIDDSPYDTTFLVSSELAPETIRQKYARLRATHKMAFVTWHASVYGKLLDHVAMVKGASLSRVSAFFHDSLIDGGVEAEFEQAAKARHVAYASVRYSEYPEFVRLLEHTLATTQPDGVLIPMSGKVIAHLAEVADLVAKHRAIAVYSRRDQVDAGGLIATDAPSTEVYDQLARYAVLILRGADPSLLEISQPSRFETTINLKAASRIGKLVPYEMLVEADRIVE